MERNGTENVSELENVSEQRSFRETFVSGINSTLNYINPDQNTIHNDYANER